MTRTRAALGALLLLVAGHAEAKEPPEWLRRAAAAPEPKGTTLGATFLLNEREVTVREDGRVTTVERRAVRISSEKGQAWAKGRVVYDTQSGKVSDIEAWLLPPKGEPRRLKSDRVVDVSLAGNDLYNEVRARGVAAGEEAVPGTVFGYEWTLQEKPLFTQMDWAMQGRPATVLARFRLSLPPGWTGTGTLRNVSGVTPAPDALAWELRDLPEIPDEPASPPLSRLAPRLLVSYAPPPDASPDHGKAFASWADVVRWLQALSEPSVPQSVVEKARALTAGAATPSERVLAVVRYVQELKYVSVQTGVGRGGGYRPRRPDEVLSRGWGDCKDQANLLRTLLDGIGVPARLVVVFNGDRDYVIDGWPTPQQFNHVIVAIEASAFPDAQAALEGAGLGRLVFFDPTDASTPFGELPASLQGSRGLVLAPTTTTLVTLPLSPPDRNRLVRRTEGSLSAEGVLRATVHEEMTGRVAAAFRRERRDQDAPDTQRATERWATARLSGGRVESLAVSADASPGPSTLDLKLSAPRFAQLAAGLLLVGTVVVGSPVPLAFGETERRLPIELESLVREETVRITVPSGWRIEERPAPVDLKTPFGAFRMKPVVEGDVLLVERRFELSTGTWPLTEYAALRAFLDKARAAARAPFVLRRE